MSAERERALYLREICIKLRNIGYQEIIKSELFKHYNSLEIECALLGIFNHGVKGQLNILENVYDIHEDSLELEDYE